MFGSGSWDKTVKLWDAPLISTHSGTELPELLPKASLDGHTQAVSCLCWREAETLYRYPFARAYAQLHTSAATYTACSDLTTIVLTNVVRVQNCFN